MKIAAGFGNQTPLEKEIELTKLTEESGLYGVSISEHVGISSNDVFASASLLSRYSRNMTLIANSVNQYTRNPISLAMAANTAAAANDGRFILGLGTGADDSLQKMGVDKTNHLSRLNEMIQITRALLEGKEVSYNGKYFAVGPTRIQTNLDSEIPIYMPAIRDKAILSAAEYGDGVFLSNYSSSSFVRYVCDLVSQRKKRSNFSVAATLSYYPSADRKQGLSSAKKAMTRYLSIPGIGETLLERSGVDSALATKIRAGQSLVSDDIADLMCVVGGKDSLEKRLEEFCRAGVSLLIVTSPTDQIESIRCLSHFTSCFD